MKIKTNMSYHHTLVRMANFFFFFPEWPTFVSLQMTNAGRGMEKGESSFIVGGNVSWYSHYGEQYGGTL